MILVDCGVLYGTKRAADVAKTVLYVTPDGIVGQQTLNALNAAVDPQQ